MVRAGHSVGGHAHTVCHVEVCDGEGGGEGWREASRQDSGHHYREGGSAVGGSYIIHELAPQDIDVAEQLVEEGVAEWTAEVGHLMRNASPLPPSHCCPCSPSLLFHTSLLPPSLPPPPSSHSGHQVMEKTQRLAVVLAD